MEQPSYLKEFVDGIGTSLPDSVRHNTTFDNLFFHCREEPMRQRTPLNQGQVCSRAFDFNRHY